MSNLNSLKKSMLSNPLVISVIVLLIILIVLSVIRLLMPSFGAGVGIKGHFGSIKGNINLEAFENTNKPALVIFYAEWCGHCKRCMPEVEKLKNENIEGVEIITIDSDKNPEMIKEHNVQGFPTIRMYPQGLSNNTNFENFNDERTLSGFKTFLERVLNKN